MFEKLLRALILWYPYPTPERGAPLSMWCDVILSRGHREKLSRNINASEFRGRPAWSIRVMNLKSNVELPSSWSGSRGQRRSASLPQGACVTRASAGPGSGGPAGARGPSQVTTSMRTRPRRQLIMLCNVYSLAAINWFNSRHLFGLPLNVVMHQ